MDAMTVAVDLAKDVFEVARGESRGRIIERKRLTRRQFERFIDTLTAGNDVVMEACGTAHYWGRRCQARGIAGAAAARRSTCARTSVAIKPTARIPKRCSKRTAVAASSRCRSKRSNSRPCKRCIACARSGKPRGQRASTSMRGVLREQGCRVPSARARRDARRQHARRRDASRSRHSVRTQWRGCSRTCGLWKHASRDRPSARACGSGASRSRRACMQVPGVGVITATALVGAVGHIHAFRRGRDFASWLGLTPRESSTGSRRYLGRISKRGDVYLRCLLTHGARAVLLTAQRTVRTTPDRATRLQHWAVTLAARRGHNKAAIAVANKLARIIWAVWHHDVEFHDHRRRDRRLRRGRRSSPNEMLSED